MVSNQDMQFCGKGLKPKLRSWYFTELVFYGHMVSFKTSDIFNQNGRLSSRREIDFRSNGTRYTNGGHTAVTAQFKPLWRQGFCYASPPKKFNMQTLMREVQAANTMAKYKGSTEDSTKYQVKRW